ncbi:uncharacterized protein LAESUDRAFT_153834 [Laetiporus sulphureus 93-53]|uniref:Uncharacterized protein n=1 Tax=Laetiporus sulphureus 93-53 TaxID=1314785 RepID=A0A165HJU3_9APHY|nr:uncharacterized protein LAESUDRAFT_153834 [Laetiporus sulphureus 93-53]KZT11822.1 hypothetical protein LAESUDRAFT_153834 [Laetiporus sulphureus 93-53]
MNSISTYRQSRLLARRLECFSEAYMANQLCLRQCQFYPSKDSRTQEYCSFTTDSSQGSSAVVSYCIRLSASAQTFKSVHTLESFGKGGREGRVSSENAFNRRISTLARIRRLYRRHKKLFAVIRNLFSRCLLLHILSEISLAYSVRNITMAPIVLASSP